MAGVKTAYTTDDVERRIANFQQTLLDTTAGKQTPAAATREAVFWTVVAQRILKQAPPEWRPTLVEGWMEVRGTLESDPTLWPWVPRIDTLLAGLFSPPTALAYPVSGWLLLRTTDGLYPVPLFCCPPTTAAAPRPVSVTSEKQAP